MLRTRRLALAASNAVGCLAVARGVDNAVITVGVPVVKIVLAQSLFDIEKAQMQSLHLGNKEVKSRPILQTAFISFYRNYSDL